MTDRPMITEHDRVWRSINEGTNLTDWQRSRFSELMQAYEAAASELSSIREGAGLTRWYGRDNSTPPQLWLWEGSRDESAEPIRRVDEKGRMVDSVAAELNSLTAEVARLKEELAGKERECRELKDKLRDTRRQLRNRMETSVTPEEAKDLVDSTREGRLARKAIAPAAEGGSNG